ncbi:6-phosphogluconolactonase [Virgibacillus pantothenticus]|uniref:6-phosphogluconolactonase n=1 Tax=Virgibacillus pantothenticus TaxID=1473 RepID=UPI0025B0BAF3|nr:6-phosphogluconolactonase [Virgibacillus pantothenticus]
MITLGFTEILKAEKVILLVSGKRKSEAVKNLLEGEISTDCPATALRDKDNVIIIIDEEAASLLDEETKK